MDIRIALAGNPNAGKTTLFNALTGSNQFVGNWPGVTVEKKEGKLKKRDGVIVTDLPGIYSLSPYTLEEVVARNYLVNERPDAILNIVDATNIERNLYLTTQLVELGIPVVIALNMMDIVRKAGDKIDVPELSRQLGCKIFEISALKGDGINEAAEAAIMAAKETKTVPHHFFSGPVEHALAHIEEAVVHSMPEEEQRWYAIKVFERDEKVLESLKLEKSVLEHIESDIQAAEKELDDDAESIITNERYIYIANILKSSYRRANAGKLSNSDKIDKIVTNRWLGLPVFALIMFFVYWFSMIGFGASATRWANEGLFGKGWHLFGMENVWIPGVPVIIQKLLESVGCAQWLSALILDGIVAGVGAVLGFVPQMLVLFLLLAFLEACGYMARIAFVLDRVFRKFGLSGKSFIPILVGTGCGVPGIMASRTIENLRDRRMTIITTTFIPCGAKVPVIAMIAGAVFGGSPWVATSAYFIGLAAIIISGIVLKKTKVFAGSPSPFVMELPAYHMRTLLNVLRSMWDRGWSFIKKAGTIILLSSIVVWFMTFFGWTEQGFGMLSEDQLDSSILAKFGSAIAWIFSPLGWGNWQMVVATLTGIVAKENIVGTLEILYGNGKLSAYQAIGNAFSGISAYSFLVFNLLCAPCVAAIAAIRREMNNAKWTWIAIGHQCGFAYLISLQINQIGKLFSGSANLVGLVFALLSLGFMIYMLFVKKYSKALA